MIGSTGNDSFDGGAGTDRVIESGDVNFVLTNASLTGVGTDTLVSVEQVSLTAAASGNNTINASAFTAGPVTLVGGPATTRCWAASATTAWMAAPAMTASLAAPATTP